MPFLAGQFFCCLVSRQVKICEPGGQGIILPIFGKAEQAENVQWTGAFSWFVAKSGDETKVLSSYWYIYIYYIMLYDIITVMALNSYKWDYNSCN